MCTTGYIKLYLNDINVYLNYTALTNFMYIMKYFKLYTVVILRIHPLCTPNYQDNIIKLHFIIT